MSKQDYVQSAFEYIDAVLTGEIPACEYVKLACLRQVNDLIAMALATALGGYEWTFRVSAANRACAFIENLHHVKGPLANKPIKLELWQRFRITTFFGWYSIDDPNRRRFRAAYTEVPRGNGKSTESAGIALYALAADKENGAEVYAAATTKEQARIVFDAAIAIAAINANLVSAYQMRVMQSRIKVPRTVSEFRPLSSDADTLDGLNTHFAIVDELHAHPTRDLYDVIETSLGKRLRSAMWIITTAGSDTSGICYEVREYTIKILQNLIIDDSHFGIIYTADKGDDWKEEATWIKANPNWNISVMPDVMRKNARKAIQTPSAVGNFKRKHLDIWTQEDSAWMPVELWRDCADPSLRLSDFVGETCWIGLDLATKIDMACKVYIFKRKIEGKTHYYVFNKNYLPQAAIDETRNSSYKGWVELGHIITTPGSTLDIDVIEESIIGEPRYLNDVNENEDPECDMNRFVIEELCYDPWHATQFATHVARRGITTVEIRNTVGNMSPPMREIESIVRSGRLHHNGCPVMTWMISNVIAKEDKKQNIFPDKLTKSAKIDGLVALLLGMNRAMIGENIVESIYEKRGILEFDVPNTRLH